MKARRFILAMVAALCWMALPVSASGLGDIRVNARFLTDRMAFELNLSNNQYNDLFEVNYDFLCNVDPYLDRLAYSDPYALDYYYRYLDERNDELRWILSSIAYTRFMALDYFFRPIYALNNVIYLRIYQRYPNRTYFYYGRPHHYYTYHGGHCRKHYGGESYYRKHYKKRYNHPVYSGNFRSRPDFRRDDFKGGRPPKGNKGYNFTPVDNPRPGAPGFRPDKDKGNSNNPGFRPGNNDNNRRPNGSSMRADKKNDKKNNSSVRPDRNESRRPNSSTVLLNNKEIKRVNSGYNRPSSTQNRPSTVGRPVQINKNNKSFDRKNQPAVRQVREQKSSRSQMNTRQVNSSRQSSRSFQQNRSSGSRREAPKSMNRGHSSKQESGRSSLRRL
ncbi:hypothetical protein [uncultured Bacteroides sp.]|uniref:hypothetical protein n=1 Tax=uncultured Bacteroides sp. TaxID=162156 RepID=UPI00260592DA|nr:hypothetical protein [uncultured Bacteroides sp.]